MASLDITSLRYPRRALLQLAGLAAVASPRAAVPAGAGTQPVTAWINRNAIPLHGRDPDAPLDDLAPLRLSIGDALVVGLGESVHGAAEETMLKFRMLRLLIERMGFRSVAWEEDWTTGLLIDQYIQGGDLDLDAVVGRMTGQWQTRQTATLLRWLRDYNAGQARKVRFVGVEYYYTGPEAYDAVDAYVAQLAPGRLAELRRLLCHIRPRMTKMQDWVDWYWGLADKSLFIRHAHEVYRLIAELPHPSGDRAHELALHHARQIVSFYEHYDLPTNDQNRYRDAHAAENLRWWRGWTGDKVAWWAASPHVAAAPDLRITLPPGPDFQYPTAGSYLREWYDHRYRSIGFTFDHGTVGIVPETTAMPPAAANWFEHPFAAVGHCQFAVDLHAPAPPPVRRWLHAPITTRGLPQAGTDSTIIGGTLAQWFDTVVHVQEVTPLAPSP